MNVGEVVILKETIPTFTTSEFFLNTSNPYNK